MNEPFDGIKNGLQDVLEFTEKDKMLTLSEANEDASIGLNYSEVLIHMSLAALLRALAEKEGE